jgi:hypothetical protein
MEDYIVMDFRDVEFEAGMSKLVLNCIQWQTLVLVVFYYQC